MTEVNFLVKKGLTVPKGSASTPSVIFDASDPNTGLYSPGADQVAVATNGTGRLFISDTGEIIVNDSGAITSSVNGPVKIRGVVAAGTVALSLINAQPSDAGATVSIEAGQQTRNGGRIVFGRENAGNWATTSLADGYISFESVKNNTNSEALRITSEGLVGIGTSSPGDALTVQGTGNSYIGLQSATSGYASLKQIVTDTSAWLRTETSHPLYLGTNQTRAITIDTSQRVGIGTTSADQLLVVSQNAASYNPAIKISNPNTGRWGGKLIFESATGAGVYDAAVIKADGGGGFGGGNLIVETAGSERCRVDGSGRLLVGTSSARSRFQVSTGFGNVTPVHQFEFNSQTYNGLSITHNAGANTYPAVLAFGKSRGSSAGSYTAVASGDGLGWLDFYGADGTNMVRAATISAEVDGTPGANDMPGRLVFSTTADGASSPTERMRITSSGNLLMGRTYDAQDANVFGIRISPSGTTYFYAEDKAAISLVRNTGADGQNILEFRRGSGSPIVGRVTVTTTSTAYVTSSDYRLKENITPITDSITRLQQLKPSRFNFIVDPDKTVDGFLAHEVQAVIPEAISGEKDEVDDDGNPVYQGIDQSKLVPLLTAALQEAIAKIETLEGMVAVNNITIDEQQHQLSTLAARLTALESA